MNLAGLRYGDFSVLFVIVCQVPDRFKSIVYIFNRRPIMTAIQAVYDGRVFIPVEPCGIESGLEVTLTIETANSSPSEKQKKLTAFRQLTREINELNRTDPLPPEFDEIIGKRVKLRELADL
jgi:hypothetical protein